MGIVWGWPVVSVAVLPFALFVLLYCSLGAAVLTGLASLAATLTPLVICDRLFYGRWTVSAAGMATLQPPLLVHWTICMASCQPCLATEAQLPIGACKLCNN